MTKPPISRLTDQIAVLTNEPKRFFYKTNHPPLLLSHGKHSRKASIKCLPSRESILYITNSLTFVTTYHYFSRTTWKHSKSYSRDTSTYRSTCNLCFKHARKIKSTEIKQQANNEHEQEKLSVWCILLLRPYMKLNGYILCYLVSGTDVGY